MGLRRLTSETAARWGLVVVILAVPVALLVAWRAGQSTPTLHARLAEAGGWQPAVLHAVVGEPLELRLISEDVVHGFAIGRSGLPSIDLEPGQPVLASLVFERPGTYTYYCTRWCGPDHWRMRGVVEVSGPGEPAPGPEPATYIGLGIDIDAHHEAEVVPSRPPSAARGAALGVTLPQGNRTRTDFIARPPVEIWASLRESQATSGLTDAQVWDLVAHLWLSTTTPATLAEGQRLYADNCAACHGETGDGRGVVVTPLAPTHEGEPAGHASNPADFTDAEHMLGASSALLQGKIVRGGMGTGMPSWGLIFTEAQTWALTDYLWTFIFEESK